MKPELSQTLLAQAGTPDLLKPSALRPSNDVLLLLGAVTVLSLVFIAWAVFFRKRKEDLSNWKVQPSRHQSSPSQHESSGHGHRRRRRRRREHRPRNPTLAETGGLPPARSQPPSETTS